MQPPVNVVDEKFFFRVVYAAFALRRKTLVNSLMTAFGSQLTKEQVTQAVTSCGLEANIRGERLGLSEFAALSPRSPHYCDSTEASIQKIDKPYGCY